MIPGRLVLSVALAALFLGRTRGSPLQDFPITRRVDVTLTQGTSMAAAASPDRQWIAIDLVGAIWILPIDGGEARRLTPELLEARQPTWAPDGQSLAFQGYEDGTWHIYVIAAAGGSAKAITTGLFDDREPAWSHDGARIAFSSDRADGTSTIWEVLVASGDIRRRSTQDGSMPIWSPNDQEITFVSRDEAHRRPRAENSRPGLWAVTAEGRERFLATAPTAAPGSMPVAAGWSSDGATLAYSTADSRLVIGNRVVSEGEDVFPFRPDWISRTSFIYTADGRIKRRSIDGVVSAIPFAAKVALQRSSYTIAHRVLEPVGPQQLTGIVSPVVSPDGRSIAFTAMGDLWVLPSGAPPVQVTNDAAVEIDPAWAPDSAQLAFASDRGGQMDLWVHDLRSNRASQLTHERAAVSGPSWAPDGNHIAYLLGHSTLTTLDLRRDAHHFAFAPSTPGELGRPTWSADSTSIAVGSLFPYSTRYREGLNQILVYSSNTDTASSSVIDPQHSAGNRQDTGPVWSPDGFHMAFVRESALWVVPVDQRGGATGPPHEVANDQPESPSWEGNSKHIVYQTPRGLRRIVADGSLPEQIPIELTWRNAVAPARVVVHAGHILDGLFDVVRGQADIIIEAGIIKSINEHRDEFHTGSVVDAGNEYVMPGLIEMHAHLDDGYGKNFGRVWLAYGVTTLRIPSINAYAGLEQREAFDAGRRPGPRVFLAGDPLDGPRLYYPGGVSVTSDEQLDRELDRASTLGVDLFPKADPANVNISITLPGASPDEMATSVVEPMEETLSAPSTSHELYPAVAFGIDGIEHLSGTSRRGYSPKHSSSGRAYQDVVDLIVKSGVTLTPTIGILGGFLAREAGDRTLLFDQRLALFPLQTAAQLSDTAATRPDPQRDERLKPYEATIKAVASSSVPASRSARKPSSAPARS